MAAKKEFDPEALELPEDEGAEFDQPRRGPSVTLDELLGDEGDAPEQYGDEMGDDAAEMPQQPSAANSQPRNKTEQTYRTQADVDRAFGQRIPGLRRQWERENADDLALAKDLRRRFPGRNPAQIQEALFQDEVNQVAEDQGLSKEEATQKVRARIEYDRRASAPDDVDPGLLEKMQAQVDSFFEEHGIDLVVALQEDESLQKKVGDDGDLRDVMIALLAKNGSQKKPAPPTAQSALAQVMQRRTAPRPERGGAANRMQTARKFTDAEIDRIDAAATAGKHVYIG